VSTALLIFAKAPVAGLAKTRLIPALGAEGAAFFAEKLLDHAVTQALAAEVDHVELCVTPDTSHAAFQRHLKQTSGRLVLTTQGDGDLGLRMDRALTRNLQHHAKVLLTGTDAPGLGPEMLREAAASLEHHDVVFVPAIDGGYALVGLKKPAPLLFSNMTWSTAQVMSDSRERARRAGLRWIELSPVTDIYEPSDLVHLQHGWI
jgi:rSAM/selenodomain-associated transferase 1